MELEREIRLKPINNLFIESILHNPFAAKSTIEWSLISNNISLLDILLIKTIFAARKFLNN